MPKKKSLRPGQWAKARPTPTANDRRIEEAFLEDHWFYAGRGFDETADALVKALATPSSPDVGHSLFLRLFAEYANALETLGAWGWTLRNRREFPSFLDAFLAYPHAAPREFFTAVRRNRSGSLILLLRLPREKRLLPALTEALSDSSEGWSEDESREAMRECFHSLRLSAHHYFNENEVIRTTYNKAKHGATILRLPDLTDRQFYVLAPHLQFTGAKDAARYEWSKFTVNSQQVRSLKNGITVAGATVSFLAGLARALLRAGLLYPRRRAGPSGRPAPPTTSQPRSS